jgi:GNAT superfamily N-acetyltransferase
VNDVPYERIDGSRCVSTDRTRLNVELVHQVLGATYWAAGIPREVVERSIAGSIAFGLYDEAEQVGFARVVTDLATYAYLCDVFVVEAHRGKGLGDWLVGSIMLHPQLQGLRRFALFTRDAASLYRRHGFSATESPTGYMEIVKRDIYTQRPAS